MPTVELDIRQLADEGGTAPLAPITVTDAVLDENGNTLTDTLDEIKSGLTYTTTETVVGTWTDGRPIYRKVYTGLNFGGTTGAWTDTGASVTNFRQVVNVYALAGSNLVPMFGFRILNGAIQYYAANSWGGTDKVVLEYTKTTD